MDYKRYRYEWAFSTVTISSRCGSPFRATTPLNLSSFISPSVLVITIGTRGIRSVFEPTAGFIRNAIRIDEPNERDPARYMIRAIGKFRDWNLETGPPVTFYDFVNRFSTWYRERWDNETAERRLAVICLITASSTCFSRRLTSCPN